MSLVPIKSAAGDALARGNAHAGSLDPACRLDDDAMHAEGGSARPPRQLDASRADLIMDTPNTICIGADVGGTFTDVVLVDERGRIWARKVPSTPADFEWAVLQAVANLMRERNISGADVVQVAHGATVATNAVLEHRGARTALVTTKGFRDVLELRRIRAPQLYDLFFDKPPALVERYLRMEIRERISAQGEVLVEPDEAELQRLARRLEAEGVESVAVCLLHSYAFPRHERMVGDFLRRHLPGVQVSVSCEVLRERREYERTATTVVNAYVRPVMQRYLGALRDGFRQLEINAPLLIMQSVGGLTPEADAALRPVYVLESGPAAGVLAARAAALRAGIKNVISFDMGGTTAKASIIEDGRISYSPEYEVGAGLSAGNRLVGGAGELIRAPTIDIAEVGAGGGSIAYLDRAGGLRVGPRSAGALPGPACYGRGGDQPTLTDANVVLGYIRPGKLANGQVSIEFESARRAVQDRIAAPMNMDLLAAAEGIHRIANAHTMRALRAVSTQRGRDPREFALIAFGGAGPIHAAHLAQELHTRQVIIPPLPGLFSAIGLLCSGVEHHESRSCLLWGEGLTAQSLESIRDEMRQPMLRQFDAEGFSATEVTLSCSVDVRFRGQSSEIRIPLAEAIDETALMRMQEGFEEEHQRLYGHRSDPDNPIEVLAVRLIGHARPRNQQRPFQSDQQPGKASAGRQAYFGPRLGRIGTPVLNRCDIDRATAGPLLIDEYDSTIVVPPGMEANLDEHSNIVLTAAHD